VWSDSSGFQLGTNSDKEVTNNIAELRGIEMVASRLAHLATLDERHPCRTQALGGVEKVYVVGDSEMVVKLVRGDQNARSPALVAILAQAQRSFRLAARSLGVQLVYQWTGREQNVQADALANEGADSLHGHGQQAPKSPELRVEQQRNARPASNLHPPSNPDDPPSPLPRTPAAPGLRQGELEGNLYTRKFDGAVAYCVVLGNRLANGDPEPWVMLEWLLCGSTWEIYREDLDRDYTHIEVPGGDYRARLDVVPPTAVISRKCCHDGRTKT
jgi:ribonuclease HI